MKYYEVYFLDYRSPDYPDGYSYYVTSISAKDKKEAYSIANSMAFEEYDNKPVIYFDDLTEEYMDYIDRYDDYSEDEVLEMVEKEYYDVALKFVTPIIVEVTE